jgi:DNA-binding ferritin-like protein (Dps family)
MIYGRRNLLEWFNTNEKPYFSIFRKNTTESGNTVFNNKSRENESMETAGAYLDKCLSLIHTGDYFIFCCKEMGSSTSKGRSETFFTVSASEAAQPPQHAVAGFGGMDYETMMNKASEQAEARFKNLMVQQELEQTNKRVAELIKENKELNAAAQKPWNKLMQEVHPYIGSIVQQLCFKASPTMAAQLPVSGVPHDDVLEENNTAQTTTTEEIMSNQVNAFCDALAARYPDEWLNIIARLTTCLKNTPDKIDMALKFL